MVLANSNVVFFQGGEMEIIDGGSNNEQMDDITNNQAETTDMSSSQSSVS